MPAVLLEGERRATLGVPGAARGAEGRLVVLGERRGRIALGLADHHHRVVRPELVGQFGMPGEHGMTATSAAAACSKSPV